MFTMDLKPGTSSAIDAMYDATKSRVVLEPGDSLYSPPWGTELGTLQMKRQHTRRISSCPSCGWMLAPFCGCGGFPSSVVAGWCPLEALSLIPLVSLATTRFAARHVSGFSTELTMGSFDDTQNSRLSLALT